MQRRVAPLITHPDFRGAVHTKRGDGLDLFYVAEGGQMQRGPLLVGVLDVRVDVFTQAFPVQRVAQGIDDLDIT